MAEENAATLRPFHETIVEAIRRASLRNLMCLATLIKATKIPKGHKEIIEAWNARCKEVFSEDFDVTDNLLDQKLATAEKRAAEKAGGEEKKSELRKEIEELFDSVQSHYYELMGQRKRAHSEFEKLRQLVSQVLGK